MNLHSPQRRPANTLSTSSEPKSSAAHALSVTCKDEEVLRGVNLPSLLWRFGGHFRLKAQALAGQSFTEEEEAAWLWSHSRNVRRLHEFVSHSWRDGALAKYLTLCLYYNGRPAALACLAMGLILFAVQAAGLLPVWVVLESLDSAQQTQRIVVSFWCTIVGAVVYPIALVSWHHFPARLGGGKGQVVFFDKLCIHQTDHRRKMVGIRSLAAFVASSERLVVLWSPTYFARLRCSFKVATLVHQMQHLQNAHRDFSGRFAFRPLRLAVLTCYIGMLALVSLLIVVLTDSSPGSPAHIRVARPLVIVGLLTGGSAHIAHMARVYIREREGLIVQLEDFNVESTACLSDKDRQVIYGTIRKWYGSIGNFNIRMRTRVCQYVKATIPSKTRVPFRMIASAYVPFVFMSLDMVAANLKWTDSSIMGARSLRAILLPFLADFTVWLMLQVVSIPWVNRERPSFLLDAMVSCFASLLTSTPVFLDLVIANVFAANPRIMAWWCAVVVAVSVRTRLQQNNVPKAGLARQLRQQRPLSPPTLLQ